LSASRFAPLAVNASYEAEIAFPRWSMGTIIFIPATIRGQRDSRAVPLRRSFLCRLFFARKITIREKSLPSCS
jgi:hypothetical protein